MEQRIKSVDKVNSVGLMYVGRKRAEEDSVAVVVDLSAPTAEPTLPVKRLEVAEALVNATLQVGDFAPKYAEEDVVVVAAAGGGAAAAVHVREPALGSIHIDLQQLGERLKISGGWFCSIVAIVEEVLPAEDEHFQWE